MAKWQKRSDYSAMMYLRSDNQNTADKKGKGPDESGITESENEEDENEANYIQIEKMDYEIGNQHDNVKSIIQNYDYLYEQHIELKKKYSEAQQEIANLKKRLEKAPEPKKDYRPGQKRSPVKTPNLNLGLIQKAVTPIEKP